MSDKGNGNHNSSVNGDTKAKGTPITEQTARLLHGVVNELIMSRTRLSAQLLDPRRDVYKECGYPNLGTYIDSSTYFDMYSRESLAARVVEVYPRECWQTTPFVYEDEDADTVTPFESVWDTISSQLRGIFSMYREEQGSLVWDYLKRLDEMSGIGRYGVMLIGIDDGLPLSSPVNGIDTKDSLPVGTDATYYTDSGSFTGVVTPSAISPDSQTSPSSDIANPGVPNTPDRKLLFLRVFPDTLAQITRLETNPSNPRFGQPIEYQITLSDPSNSPVGAIGTQLSTVLVHWTRVIHVADVWHHGSTSETLAVPRMQPVLNHLLDLRKLYGGSAEMYWKGAAPSLVFETHPNQDITEETVDVDAIKDSIENFMNSLKRYLLGIGGSWKILAPAIVDPSTQIDKHIQAICIKLGIPIRILMGSERGELASTQDDDAWNDRVKEREVNYVIPRIIVPFIDRLIYMRVLPKPKPLNFKKGTSSSPSSYTYRSQGGYTVKWEDITSTSAIDKTRIMVRKVQAIASFIASGAEAVMSLTDFYTRIMGFTEEEAQAILDNLDAHDKVTSTGLSVSDPSLLLGNPPSQGNQPNQDGQIISSEISNPGNPAKGKTPKFGPTDSGTSDREKL